MNETDTADLWILGGIFAIIFLGLIIYIIYKESVKRFLRKNGQLYNGKIVSVESRGGKGNNGLDVIIEIVVDGKKISILSMQHPQNIDFNTIKNVDVLYSPKHPNVVSVPEWD